MGLSIGPQKDMSCFVGLHDESMCVCDSNLSFTLEFVIPNILMLNCAAIQHDQSFNILFMFDII